MLQDLGFSPQDEVGWRLAAALGALMRGKVLLCNPSLSFVPRYSCTLPFDYPAIL